MMIDYLKFTGKRYNNYRGGKISFKDLLLQMENARPHAFKNNPRIFGQLMGTTNQTKSVHARLESLFRKIKSDLKWVDSDGPDDVRRKVQHIFRHMSEN